MPSLWWHCRSWRHPGKASWATIARTAPSASRSSRSKDVTVFSYRALLPFDRQKNTATCCICSVIVFKLNQTRCPATNTTSCNCCIVGHCCRMQLHLHFAGNGYKATQRPPSWNPPRVMNLNKSTLPKPSTSQKRDALREASGHCSHSNWWQHYMSPWNLELQGSWQNHAKQCRTIG